MKQPTSINEFDIVFISYDEPNADENYAHLLDICPWAMRSHGVWGSDAAHKAAAGARQRCLRRPAGALGARRWRAGRRRAGRRRVLGDAR